MVRRRGPKADKRKKGDRKKGDTEEGKPNPGKEMTFDDSPFSKMLST